MDKNEILSMEEGSELDALVAEKVMGWRKDDSVWGGECWKDTENRYQHSIGMDGEYDSELLHLVHWHPSSSILWAWEITEKLMDSGWGMVLMNKYSHSPHRSFEYGVDLRKDGKAVVAYGETAPLAICRAALLTVLGDND